MLPHNMFLILFYLIWSFLSEPERYQWRVYRVEHSNLLKTLFEVVWKEYLMCLQSSNLWSVMNYKKNCITRKSSCRKPHEAYGPQRNLSLWGGGGVPQSPVLARGGGRVTQSWLGVGGLVPQSWLGGTPCPGIPPPPQKEPGTGVPPPPPPGVDWQTNWKFYLPHPSHAGGNKP